MENDETDTCHICQAEYNEATTPGEFCYTCCRCDELVCTGCSENDPEQSNRVICDDCWTDDDEERDSDTANAGAVATAPRTLD